MDEGHHGSKFHHMLGKITLDIWRDKALVCNYLLPDMDKGLNVFIISLLTSITHFWSFQFWRFADLSEVGESLVTL